MKSSNPPFFDKKPVYDDDWIYDETICKICGNTVSDHTSGEAVDCALKITKGGN